MNTMLGLGCDFRAFRRWMPQGMAATCPGRCKLTEESLRSRLYRMDSTNLLMGNRKMQQKDWQPLSERMGSELSMMRKVEVSWGDVNVGGTKPTRSQVTHSFHLNLSEGSLTDSLSPPKSSCKIYSSFFSLLTLSFISHHNSFFNICFCTRTPRRICRLYLNLCIPYPWPGS